MAKEDKNVKKMKDEEKIMNMKFSSVGQSQVSLWHRPSFKDLKDLIKY
jgi:hypothetical protein